MHNPVLIQGIGLLALLVAVSIYQINNRKAMLLLGVGASLLWATHYVLLGAATGVAMNILGATRGIVYYRVRPSKHNRWILWSFVAITLFATALTWQGLISLLPTAGSLTGVIAYWQKNPKYIRRLDFVSSPPWLVYNAISGSYPGIVVEILLMASNLLGQYRFDFSRSSRRKLLRAAKPA